MVFPEHLLPYESGLTSPRCCRYWPGTLLQEDRGGSLHGLRHVNSCTEPPPPEAPAICGSQPKPQGKQPDLAAGRGSVSAGFSAALPLFLRAGLFSCTGGLPGHVSDFAQPAGSEAAVGEDILSQNWCLGFRQSRQAPNCSFLR